MTGDGIVAAARGCVGARFRPWGRDPALGLDCVGLAAHALGVPAPRNYALRGGDPGTIAKRADSVGLKAVAGGVPQPGDLMLLDERMGQLHLAIWTGAGFIHADARLRRVVETTGRSSARIISIWRKEG